MAKARRVKFIVEGAWEDNDGAGSVTADWIVARDADEAERIVTEARSRIDNWIFDRAVSLTDYAKEQRRIIHDLRRMTLAEVQGQWADTLKDLGVIDEDDE